MLFSYKLLLFLCALFEAVLAVELVPVRPKGLTRRDLTGLDLRNTESLLWENPEDKDAVLANFTILATGAKENVLSMEKFDGLLTSVSCSPQKLVLQFEDKKAFSYASRVWDWVNGEDDNTFIMIAGIGDCGDNKHRIPYRVFTIAYDPAHFKATLAVKTGKWKDIVTSYDFHAESRPGSGVAKRGEANGGKGISLNQEFPLKFKLQRGPLIVEVECDNCRTTGNIGYSFDIRQNIIGLPNQAILKIDPKGVAAIAELKLTVEGEFKKTEVDKFEKEILSIPLNGWSINNIFEIGPYLDIFTGVEVVGIKGSVSAKGGATISLDDAAYLEADLLHLTRSPIVRGWTPHFTSSPFSVAANIATTLQCFLTPKIRLKAEGLNLIGVQTGVEIKSIPVEVKLEATTDSSGVCEDPTRHFGISASYSSGFEVMWTAGKSTGGSKPVIETTFGNKMWEWPIKHCIGCTGLGTGCKLINPNQKPVGTWVQPTKAHPKTTTTAKKPAATGYGKCKNSPGECISTTKCKNTGGVSKAGFCPGGKDIQCCNYQTGSGDYCTAGGINGICKPTSSCKSGGGTSVSGHCRGPKDIQCCVPKSKAKPAANKKICTISKAGLKTSGFVGECMSTSACKGGKGTSTPGFCPGGNDVQCCTYGTCAQGVAGVCEPVSSCTGTPRKGLCGGGANIQCCTHPEWKSHPGQT